MSHTKEPWNCDGADEDGDIVFADRFLEVVAETSREDGDRQKAFANAARIVACVNACAGIADPSSIPVLVAAAEVVIERATANDAHSCWKSLSSLKDALAKLKGGTA